MPDTTDAFLLFALIATLSPGGATTAVTSSGIQHGFLTSLSLILGIATGLAGLAAAGALGFGVLVATYPAIDLTIKLAGSAYLFWLATKIWRANPPAEVGASVAKPFGFLNGVMLTVLNPKGWAMTMAAAVTFSAIADDPQTLAMTMALTFGLAAILSLSVWCAGGVLISQRLTAPGHWQIVNRTLALLLAACIAPLWL